MSSRRSREKSQPASSQHTEQQAAAGSARERHASSAASQATAGILYGSKISRSLRCAGHVTDFTTLPPTRRLSSSLPVKVVAIRPLQMAELSVPAAWHKYSHRCRSQSVADVVRVVLLYVRLGHLPYWLLAFGATLGDRLGHTGNGVQSVSTRTYEG